MSTPPPPSVVVLPVRADGVSEVAGKLLTEQLMDAIRRTEAFSRVVGMGDIEQAMAMEQRRQLLDCNTDNCAAELAGALGVDLILVTSVGRLGSVFLLSARLMEARSANLRASATQRGEGEDEQVVLSLVGPLVDNLLQFARPAPAPVPAAAPALATHPWRPVGITAATAGAAVGLLGLAVAGVAAATALLVRVAYVPIHAVIPDPAACTVFWNVATVGGFLVGAGVVVLAGVLLTGGVAAAVLPSLL